MRGRMKLFGLAIGICLLSISTEAGTFLIEDVWYKPGPATSSRMNMRVGASARYDGSPDLNDRMWAIQATLTVTEGNVTNPHHGSPVQGTGVETGMTIKCSDEQCGGSQEFDRCPAKTYGGYGLVTIYHQYTPEIDRRNLVSGSSDCVEEPPDTLGDITPEDHDGDSGGGGEGPTEPSPIVIDLDRGGFRFTDLSGGVEFDLDGVGPAEAISWLAAGSGDAWLALDRDGDGTIGSGAELFGNFTPQPPTASPHGYLALAVFDAPAEGGNGDGAITAGDAVFDALRLWIDTDHDGVSQPGELHPLAAAGVRALDLGFVESRRRDPHGNQLRYTSRVDLDRGTTQATDVFLLVAP